MYEVDFLPVENEAGDSSKSGDAIAMRFDVPSLGRPAVVVIDGGFTAIGEKLVEHITEHYATTHIDLVISTHPDTDHLNGLRALLETFSVGELLMHLPWEHKASLNGFGNLDAVRSLYDLAIANRIVVTEPFTGLSRLDGLLTVLGPTPDYYDQMLDESLDEVVTGKAAERFAATASGFFHKAATRVLERVVAFFPALETLTDVDDTGPRNKMSVITLVDLDGHRMLFTGDAGIVGLENAADEYEARYGTFATAPLSFFQAPHHGSKHNLGPAILNRLFGAIGQGFSAPTAFISSAKLSEKHPSPKVTNALGRRGARVFVTEGRTICHAAPMRDGWSALAVVEPLQEDD